MQVLVPIDSSDCSFRALEFAADFVRRYEASIHVVYFVDQEVRAEQEEAQTAVERAEGILEEAGIVSEPQIETDVWMAQPFRYADRVGKDILHLVEEEGYDHVVMGHHGSGAVTRFLMGSATETVVRGTTTPVTVIP